MRKQTDLADDIGADDPERRASDLAAELAATREALEREIAERETIIEHVAQGLSVFDGEGNVLYRNAAARRILGIGSDEQIPNTAAFRDSIDAWQMDGTPIPRGAFPGSRAFRGETVEGVELRVRSPWRDEEVVCRYDAVPIKDRFGRVRRVVATFEDITGRKRAEEALRERNERLQLLSDAAAALLGAESPEGLVLRLFDLIAGRLDLDGCFSFLVNDEGDALRLDCCVGIPDEEARRLTRLEFGEAVCGTVAQTRRPIHAADIQGSEDPKVQLVRGYGIRAYACNPLMAGGRLLGTLSFATRRRDRFSAEDLAFFRTVSHYIALAYERLRAERAVRDAAEQRRLALEAADLGTWDYDLVGGTISWDERCRAIFGIDADGPASFEQAIARVHPEDRPAAVRAFEAAVAPGATGAYEMEKRIGGSGGSAVRWVIARGQVYFAGEGAGRRPVRMIGAAMDVTERRRAEAELAAAHRRTSEILESITDSFYAVDHDWRLTYVNRRTEELWGRPREEILGRRLWDLFPHLEAEATEGYRAHMEAARERRPLQRELHSAVLGTWVSVSIYPHAEGLSVYFRDISERKRAEERQGLLLAELDHRVKNMLATIQSLVAQTRTSSESLDDFSAALEGRIQALAHAHSLLTQSRWEAAGLRAIVAEELRPFAGPGDGNAVIDGPDLALRPKAALALSLALHELTTNAAKYGALSVPEGRIEVRWEVADRGDDAGGRVLALRWTERGGPPVEPPRRRGFGRTVIERSLAYEVDGEARLDFAPEGVTCAITIPLDQLIEARSGEGRRADGAARPGVPPHAERRGAGALAKRILVVEDSMLVAMEIEAAVRANGWEVAGPAGSLTGALRLAREERELHGAVLDINLDGAEVFPVADALRERGVPFVFATGYDPASVLPAHHQGVPTLRKPFAAAELRAALRAAFA